MARIVTARSPEAGDLSQRERHEIVDWLEAQGIPARRTRVVAVELDLIDCPLVRVTRLALNQDGRPYRDPDHPTHLARTVTEHAQRADPPAWWRPAA